MRRVVALVVMAAAWLGLFVAVGAAGAFIAGAPPTWSSWPPPRRATA